MLKRIIPLLIFVPLLAACTQTVNSTKLSCAGWKEIPIMTGTAGYLSKKDPEAAQGILVHNKYGNSIGCWNNGKQ